MSGLDVCLVASKTLTNTNQLRLDILDVENAHMWPDAVVEESVSLVPRPRSRGEGCHSGEMRGRIIALSSVRRDKLIAWNKIFIV